LLRDTCPHLYQGENDTRTCCSADQLITFNQDVGGVPRQLLARCPACYLNFRAFLCDLTCSPKQSEFLVITGEEPYDGSVTTPAYKYDDQHEETFERRKRNVKEQQMQVTRLSYYISHYYAYAMFNSCKYNNNILFDDFFI
jgi:Niemann-Pick C1 protein